LAANLLRFAIRDQRIRDFAKRALDSLLIIDQQKIALRLSEPDVVLNAPTRKDRLRDLSGKRPNTSAAVEETRQLTAFITKERSREMRGKYSFFATSIRKLAAIKCSPRIEYQGDARSDRTASRPELRVESYSP
jgi:hypothetical protein